MNVPVSANRRQFLQGSAAVGLVVGFHLPGQGRAHAADATGEFVPNAFIRIAPDNTVTVLSKHIEFGQGPYTGIATILAEELDADWAQMRVESAPADATKYANSAFGVQGTGGSTAMANSWDQLRTAGAEARARLVAAAAKQWGVDAGSITKTSLENGFDPHGFLGSIIVVLMIVLVVIALVGRIKIRVAAILLALGIVQMLLAWGASSAAWVGFFHGVNALLIAGLAGSLAGAEWREARVASTA